MFIEGAMIFSLITLILMTLSINDLSITIKNATPRIMTLGITAILSAVYAGCLVSDIVMLSVSMLNVIAPYRNIRYLLCLLFGRVECLCNRIVTLDVYKT